ncbi:MAG: UDP-N-acetylmuramoyl-L-alanyl-D-glutamate--2,6-diaminopimelate ligase, partial [Nitrospirales bacterium]|nr:UDP-N-acetylmuramoyl-L-alanyl-D-glutamate--2,6-diaminopimelate ligase [Nitrospirales bacterium]
DLSSHSLVQKRVEHAHFSVAVFTNLTRDHLDYHQTMEAYFHAKERLFTHLLDPRGAAVINSDDSYGRMLAEKLRGMGRRVITSSAEGRETELQALDVKISFTGTAFTLRYNDDDHVMRSPLLGMKNMENILSAVGVALALEIPFEVIRRAIESFRAVKGRFERVDLGQRFLAVVDYAHTGDALDGLLRMSRDLLGACNSEGRGRLITVFGCGGNRDKGKRPEMGRIASDMSDTVIVTSDNPRDEDPLEIIKEIEAGMEGKEHIVIPERASAIRKAVELASAGDMVVIAGKGHEDYQEIRGERYHFSDRETLEDAIRECLQICAGREE